MLVHAVWMVYRNQLVYYSADTAYLSIGFANFFRKFFASAQNVKKGPSRGTLHKEGAPRRLLQLNLTFLKRCSLYGYAVSVFLRSAIDFWNDSSISSGVSSSRIPTPL